MAVNYSQDFAVVIDFDDLVTNVKQLGGTELDLAALLEHLRREMPVRRTLRRIHVVLGCEQLPGSMATAFRTIRADVHYANGGRPDCLVYSHALRAAEMHDVISLVAGKASYLPLIRDIKSRGTRVELHVGPGVDRALLAAADECVGLPIAIALHSPRARNTELLPHDPINEPDTSTLTITMAEV